MPYPVWTRNFYARQNKTQIPFVFVCFLKSRFLLLLQLAVQRTPNVGRHSVNTVNKMKTASRWTATVLAAAAVFFLVVDGRPNQVVTPTEHSVNSPFVRRRSSGISRRSTTTPDILRQHLKQVCVVVICPTIDVLSFPIYSVAFNMFCFH